MSKDNNLVIIAGAVAVVGALVVAMRAATARVTSPNATVLPYDETRPAPYAIEDDYLTLPWGGPSIEDSAPNIPQLSWLERMRQRLGFNGGTAPTSAAHTADNNTMNNAYDAIFKKYAAIEGLDWRLLKAIAIVESTLTPGAKNPSDPSYGLMQVLCINDGPNSICSNRFNILGWDEATPERLYDPDFNVRMASQILKWNIDTYGNHKGVAVYNNWSARNDPEFGPFRNAGYVSKVLSAYVDVAGFPLLGTTAG